jgi:hypothetical protein
MSTPAIPRPRTPNPPQYRWAGQVPQCMKLFLVKPRQWDSWVLIEDDWQHGRVYVPALRRRFRAEGTTPASIVASQYLRTYLSLWLPDVWGAYTTTWQGEFRSTSPDLAGQYGLSNDEHFNTTFYPDQGGQELI